MCGGIQNALIHGEKHTHIYIINIYIYSTFLQSSNKKASVSSIIVYIIILVYNTIIIVTICRFCTMFYNIMWLAK